MNIGGALGIIGNATLQGYSWGPLVMAIANTHLPPDQQISLSSTGLEASEKILGLEDNLNAQIFAMDIGPLEGAMPIKEHNLFTFKTITLILAAVMAVVTIGMSISSAYHSVDASGTLDADSFTKVLEAFIDLIKVMLGVN